MRILVYNWRDLAHPCAGGAEVYTDAVAAEWIKMGHSVTWFCAAVEGHPERETSPKGYDIVRRGSKYSVYREGRRFWETEGDGKFDLVIDEVNTKPFGCPKWVHGTPVLGLIHQVAKEIWHYEAPWPVSWIGRYWLEPRWLKAFRDVPVVTVSESSRQSLEEYGLRNVRVVPEGYEPPMGPAPSVTKAPPPTIAFVGRLSPNKRPDHAIEAFRLLRKSIPDAQMWVIGDGPMLLQLIRSAPEGVTFFGRVDNELRSRLVCTAHVLIATSVREGWGLVVTEAAALGTPTVAYDVPGLRDSVTASGGVLVKESSRRSLAQTLVKFARGESSKSDRLVPRVCGVNTWQVTANSILSAVLSSPEAGGATTDGWWMVLGGASEAQIDSELRCPLIATFGDP